MLDVGDTLVPVTSGMGGAMIGRAQKVSRVTPSGQVVLVDGTRLKENRWRGGSYKEMGRDRWDRTSWYLASSDVVKDAAAEQRVRNARHAVRTAADDFWRESTTENAEKVIEAARAWIEVQP